MGVSPAPRRSALFFVRRLCKTVTVRQVAAQMAFGIGLCVLSTNVIFVAFVSALMLYSCVFDNNSMSIYCKMTLVVLSLTVSVAPLGSLRRLQNRDAKERFDWARRSPIVSCVSFILACLVVMPYVHVCCRCIEIACSHMTLATATRAYVFFLLSENLIPMFVLTSPGCCWVLFELGFSLSWSTCLVAERTTI